ncbi:MAG TPA: YceI family protein [Thermoanaerobaculia bacterium]
MASAATSARAATAAPVSAPEVYAIDTAHSEAAFQVRHLVTKVRGRFKNFSGTIRLDRGRPDHSSVEFSIEAASIDTDVPDRDTHLRSPDFFDVEKFPRLTFTSSRIQPAGDRYDVTGTLTMRGVSKEITLPVTFLGFSKDPWGNEKAGFELETRLNRKDYGMVWNAALDSGGLLLSDEVAVTINLETNREKASAEK